MSFLDFLGQYWPYILQGVEILLGIVAFILFILNKKGKISSSIASDAMTYIYKILPALINATEQLGFSGADKKETVIQALLQLLSDYFGRSLSFDELCRYRVVFDGAIEDILTTPQKKERKD